MLAVAIVLASWMFLSAVLLGLGRFTLRLVASEPQPVGRAFWIGFCGAIAALQPWHLVAPVDWRALLVLAALAAIGFGIAPRPVALSVRPASWKTAVVLVVVAVWLADRSLGPPVGDAGLYHLSFVRWAKEYPIVPGLANLHRRLGFNSPSLLWTALADVRGLGTHVSTSLLVAAAALRGIAGVSRAFRGADDAVDAYWAVLLAPVIGQAVTLHELRISTPDPDTAMAMVAFAAGGEFVALLLRPSRSGAFAAIVLAICAACLKVTALPFAALMVGIVVLRFRPPVVATAAAAAALVLPWLARSVILTGYPLYPLSIGAVPVDWRVPADAVDGLRAAIRGHFMPPAAWRMSAGRSWAWGWLLWQLTRCPELILMPAILGAIGAFRAHRHAVLWLLLPCAGALALWTTSPAPRFGYAFAWMMTAALWLTVRGPGWMPPAGARRWSAAAMALLAVVPVAHRVAAWTIAGDSRHARETLLVIPAAGLGFHGPPDAELDAVATRSGLSILVPRDGDNVWNGPLPSTPEFRPDLELRRPPHLQGGFLIR